MYRRSRPTRACPRPLPADILDLDSDVEQAVAIEVPEFIDRVQLGGEREALPQTYRAARSMVHNRPMLTRAMTGHLT